MIKTKVLTSVGQVPAFFLYGICEDDYHPLWASVSSVVEKAMKDAMTHACDIVSSYLESSPVKIRVYLSDRMFPVVTGILDKGQEDDRQMVLEAYAKLGTIPPHKWSASTVGVSLVFDDQLVGAMRETGDNTRLTYGLPSPRRFYHTGDLTPHDKRQIKNPLMVIASVAQMGAIISSGMKGELDPHSLNVSQRNIGGVVDSLSSLALVATNQQSADEHPFMF